MISAEACSSWLPRVSKVPFADEISRPRTNAAIVAISAIPSFTTSFVSVLRCSSGNTVRKSRPISAPPKTHAKAMQPTAIGLRIYLPPAAPSSVRLAKSARTACRLDHGRGSSASVCEFQCYEAGDRDGEVEMPDHRLQISPATGEWVDCNYVSVTRGGQCGE